MPDQHAFLSPSASHRWLHCTPCAALEAAVPPRDTVYTHEGTLAHAIGENLLKTYLGAGVDEPLEQLLAKIREEGFDADEMLETVRAGYTDRVIEQFEAVKAIDPTAILLVETRVRMSPYAPECWGTSDVIILGNRTVHVWDYKHGKGVKVAAVANPQMMLYALGAYEEFGWMMGEVKTISMTICQPRIRNWDSAQMELSELLKWARDVVTPKAAMAAKGEGNPNAGEWCRFCRVAPTCKALASYAARIVGESKTNQLMTDTEFAAVLTELPVIETWCTKVKEHALTALAEGRAIPGFKIVEGRSISKLTDPDTAYANLREKGYADSDILAPRSLKGLTELKKILGTKTYNALVAPCVTKPPGKPTVVPDDDPRPVINQVNPDEIFKDI